MEVESRCRSCSMPIESGSLCEHCSDADGELLPFAECFERFAQWLRRREAELPPAEVERRTLEFMATMPAWAEHPELEARLGRER